MKLLILFIFLFQTIAGYSQTIQFGQSPVKDLYGRIGDVDLVYRGVHRNKIKFPSLDTIPNNAYYLQPNGSGIFTKQMIEDLVASGEDYIIFDADTLNIHYEESIYTSSGWDTHLLLEIKAPVESPVTLDFSNVYINCYPNAIDELLAHRAFVFENCENLIVKFGDVEGDKFKRALSTNEETNTENTQLFYSGKGTKNLIIEGGYTAGFMGDVGASNVMGEGHIDTTPLANSYYVQSDGRYESVFYTINTTTYSDFGLVGGLGYNRLLYYDMEDVKFKFYNASDVLIDSIVQAKYFERYAFPTDETIVKMKVNVRAMDGRTESPTNFGHNLQYNPNIGTIVRNTSISDNHRGGIANIGSHATIDNVHFFNTQRYFDAPKFGINGNTNSTTYHINCEDAVSRDLVIKNSVFSDKFHKVLLTHNISADIDNNTFTGYGNNVFAYDLISGYIRNNTFSPGIVNGGQGTNKGNVIISNNTGNPKVNLTNGAEWTNNTFTGADISGKGKANNNTFTNSDYGYVNFTKEIYGNTFIGNDGSVPYIRSGAYIYDNDFVDTYLRFNHDTYLDAPIVLDSITMNNSASPAIYALDRAGSSSSVPVVCINSTFNTPKIKHSSVNQATNYVEGSWYFENVDFTNIENHFLYIGSNVANENPAKFYFKDCTFTGSGNFMNTIYGGMNYEITFDNCTIAETITMNVASTNAPVTLPTFTEPRTQPIPVITYNVDRTEIATDFHIMTLKIRNKNTQEIVLDADVNSTYFHYNATPNDFEYSIDGGVYWDEINN